jgi:TRAP-type uncharacterized transport system substrate-binding protein
MIRLLPVALIAAFLSGCDSGPRELTLIRPDTLIDQDIAGSVVDLLGNDAAVRIRQSVEPMSGGDALLAVASGEADIALISNDQPFRDDVATVMPLYATVLHIVHLADSSPSDVIELLRGANIFAGSEGSASRRVFERLTANLDLGDAPYSYIDDPRDTADVAVIFAPIAPERLAEFQQDLTLWSMGVPGEIGNGGTVDSVVLLNPHFRPFVIPEGTYGSATPRPVVTIAVDKILVARKDLEPSVVYDLINEILRIRPALASTYPGLMQDMSDDFDASRSRFLLHAGTQDYLQRSEPTFVERYSGVAEVLVTLLVASISAAFAGIRIYNRRRKNRIDRFYSEVIAIRRQVADSEDDAVNQKAASRLRALQDEAFELLVDEKLAADESFRIFITLSNDALEQISTTD